METFPPERSSNLAPTSSSSSRICDEIAGCVRKRFSAAREKLLSRATSRKVSSWSKSIVGGGPLARDGSRGRPHLSLGGNRWGEKKNKCPGGPPSFLPAVSPPERTLGQSVPLAIT